jgi:hypothetical protein
MGGKRIAEQVRRALIAAAKTMAVAGAIDAAGCSSSSSCAYSCREDPWNPCPVEVPDAGMDARVTDASKDGR